MRTISLLLTGLLVGCSTPDDGRVSAITVTTERAGGRLNVLVEIVDAAQAVQTFSMFVKVG